MIHPLSILLAVSAFSAPSTSTVSEVEAIIDDWHDAAAKAEEERYFAHFTEDGVFMGTDATERWTRDQFRVYAHPHFAKSKAWTLKPRDRHVALSTDGNTAWFDERVNSPKYGEGRGTGVLVRGTQGWKIAHYNYTVPIPNDKFMDVLKLIGQPKP